MAAKDIPVEIKKADEHWNVYTLSDGSTLRLKPIIVEVMRRAGQFSADGEPVYGVRSTLVVDVKAPRTLKKKPGKK